MKYLKKSFPYLIVAFISYTYLSLYSHYMFATNPANDEGTMIGAWRILHGQMIYRDFFEVFFPGDFYIMAGLYKLFGYSIAVSNQVTIVLSCTINLLLYHISRLVIKRWYAILAPLLFLTFGYTEWFTLNHYLTSTITLFLTLIALNRFMHSGRDTYVYLSGLLAGSTAVLLQSTGVYTIALLTPLIYLKHVSGTSQSDTSSIGRQKKLAALKFLSGAAVPLTIMLLLLAVHGAFVPFLRDQHILLVLYPKINMFYMGPFASIRYIFEPLRLLFISTFVLSLFFLFKQRNALPQESSLFIGNIILFLNVTHRIMLVVPTTTYINMGLSIVFSVYVLWRLEELLKRVSWKLICKLIKGLFNIVALAGAAAVCVIIYNNVKKIDTKAYHFELDHEHLWSFDRYGASTLVEFITQADKLIGSDRNVLAYPFAPLLYPVMGINNPTAYDLVPSFGTKISAPRSMLEDVLSRLKSSHNEYIITHNWSYPLLMQLYKMNNMEFHPNSLERLILEHYDTILKVGSFSLLKFTTSPQASFVDVLLIGATRKTGVFTLLTDKDRTTPTLLGLLKYAGGIQQKAALNSVIIIRNGLQTVIDLTRYFQTGDRQSNPLLDEHDVIYVPGETAPLDSPQNRKLIEDFYKSYKRPESMKSGKSPGHETGHRYKSISAITPQLPIKVTIVDTARYNRSLSVDMGTRLMYALVKAEGPVVASALKQVIIIRGNKLIRVNLLRYLKTRAPGDNPLLRDNDIVYVPGTPHKTIRVTVFGAVKYSRSFTLNDGARLANAFTMTGGHLPASDYDSIVILRHDRPIKVDLMRYVLTKDQAYNPLLQNNDIIYVPGIPHKTISVTVIGAVRYTGSFILPEHARLADTFTLTGGLLPVSDLNSIVILRHDRLITTDFINYIQTKDAVYNPSLEDDDIVYVPKGNEHPDIRYIKKMVHSLNSGAAR
ncbi:MAG: SLBB domain-containing protein [Deltaproteobacteria bacterium]|nr:SLBB domain-containing protein [Deltaproteobacteria bacterium]MCL5277732.1 SLBB domain-containing protein [Deltaproteobacteria bacterium]